MPDRCCIPECRAISNRINGKLSMFRLPRDAALKAKWLRNIGKKDFNPSDKAVICERHFDPACISKRDGIDGPLDKNGRRWKSRIALGAMPTILVPAGMPALTEPVPVRVRKRRRGRNKKLTETRKKRGRKKKEDLDSMPLQQRLTNHASAAPSQEPEKPIPTLKSQPLSPTKLKVTRQSMSRPQQQEPEPVEEVRQPIREEICLKWNTHHLNMQSAFPALLNKEQYCDVTLVAEGKSLKCHKLILSLCSSYFDEILEKVTPLQHPIVFMKDIPFNILKALCDFMYIGEVNILHSDLDLILQVGESLKVKGLASRSESKDSTTTDGTTISDPQKVPAKSSPKPPSPEKDTPTENDVDITDPLDLLEPTYEEAATPDIPPPVLKRSDSTRKSTGRRVRKRKHVEDDHEPSPPVFRMRKGTRSRPNVKVPRYFNANFDNSTPEAALETTENTEPNQIQESIIDPYINILEQIKTEPLDIEDDMMGYPEETFNQDMSNVEPEMDLYEPVPKTPETEKVVKKRKLTRRPGRPKRKTLDTGYTGTRTTRSASRGRMANLENSDVRDSDTGAALNESSSLNDVNGASEEMQLENSDREYPPVENSGMEELPLENRDREELPLENSDREEMQLENSEYLPLENSDRPELPLENSDREEMHLENSEYLPLENSDRPELPLENSDREEMQLKNSQYLPLENSEREELPPENSDREAMHIENSEYLPVENSDREERPTEREERIGENIESDTLPETSGVLQFIPSDDFGLESANKDREEETSEFEKEQEGNNENQQHNSENELFDGENETQIENSERDVENSEMEEMHMEKEETAYQDIRIEDGFVGEPQGEFLENNTYQEIRIESTYTDESQGEICESGELLNDEDGVPLENSEGDINTEEGGLGDNVPTENNDEEEKSESMECNRVSPNMVVVERSGSDHDEAGESNDQNVSIPNESSSREILTISAEEEERNNIKGCGTTLTDSSENRIE